MIYGEIKELRSPIPCIGIRWFWVFAHHMIHEIVKKIDFLPLGDRWGKTIFDTTMVHERSTAKISHGDKVGHFFMGHPV